MPHRLSFLILFLALLLPGLRAYAEPPSQEISKQYSSFKEDLKAQKETHELVKMLKDNPKSFGLLTQEERDLVKDIHVLSDLEPAMKAQAGQACDHFLKETSYTSKNGNTEITVATKLDTSIGIPVVGIRGYFKWDSYDGWAWKAKTKQSVTSGAFFMGTQKNLIDKDGEHLAIQKGVLLHCDYGYKVEVDESSGLYNKDVKEGGGKFEGELPFLGFKGGGSIGVNGESKDFNGTGKCYSAGAQSRSGQIFLPPGRYPIQFVQKLCAKWAEQDSPELIQHQWNLLKKTIAVAKNMNACSENNACPPLKGAALSEEIAKHLGDRPKGPSYDILQQKFLVKDEDKKSLGEIQNQHDNATAILETNLERTCQFHKGKSGLETRCDIVLKKGAACFESAPSPNLPKVANNLWWAVKSKDWSTAEKIESKLTTSDARALYFGHSWDIPCRADTECWNGFCRSRVEIKNALVKELEYRKLFNGKMGNMSELKHALSTLKGAVGGELWSDDVNDVLDTYRGKTYREKNCREGLVKAFGQDASSKYRQVLPTKQFQQASWVASPYGPGWCGPGADFSPGEIFDRENFAPNVQKKLQIPIRNFGGDH